MNRFAIIFGALTFVSTLAGGLFAVRYRKRSGILAAFAAGVLIAVSLFDLFPEAFRLAATAGVPLERVMYVTAVGFIFLLILERYFSVHRVCLPDGTCTNVHHHLKMAYKVETFPKPRNFLGFAKSIPVPEMEKLILTHLEIKDGDLRTLASQRATKVKEAIVKSGQVEPERIFILEPKSLAPEKKEKLKDSRVDFKLK